MEILRVPVGADTSAFIAGLLRDAARKAEPFSLAPCIHIAGHERRARLISRQAGELYPQGTADRVARELLRLFAPELEARGGVERDFDFFAAMRETLDELGEARRPGRALVDQLITAWQRLAQTIPPTQRDAAWLDALGSRGELFRGVVRRYTARLAEVGSYDAEDALWLATERLPQWKFAPRLVVIDDVDRITPAREALIRALALKADRTLAICAGIRGAGDELAFTAESHDTLQALMHEIGGRVIEERTDWPKRPLAAMSAAWMNDEPAPAGNLAVLRPATRAAEVREAARAVKRAHHDGVALSDICVAMPSLSRYRELIEEAFSAAGIPYDAPFEVPLSQAAPVAPLLDLLRAARNGLERNELLDALASPFLPFEGNESQRMEFLSGLEQTTREAWVTGGKDTRKDWIARLDEKGGEKWPPLKARTERLLSLLAPFTRRNLRAVKFFEALEWLLAASGVDGVVKADRVAGNEGAALRAGALHAFKRLLRQMREEFERTGNPDLPMAELARALTEQAERRSIRPPEAAAERVRVLGLRELRGVSFERVIVIGLTDQDLPLAEETTLFLPAAREEAIAARIADANPSRIARELCAPIDVTAQADYLFAHTLLAAGSTLTLMFPAAEGDTPCVPATPLARLLRCVGKTADELPACADQEPPTSAIELAVTAARMLAKAERESQTEPAEPGRPVVLNETLLTGVQSRCVELARTDPASPPGVYEGMLGELPELAARFAAAGDDRHKFSPSQLDNYAECPLRFWARYIVGVKTTEDPTLDTRPHAIGTLLHDVFERFVLLLRAHAGQPETLPDPVTREAIKLSDHGGRETGLKLMAQAFEQAAAVQHAQGPFWEGVKKLVAAGLPGHAYEGLGTGLLARFIDAELERNASGNGIRFVEFTFGRKDEGPDSVESLVELTIEGGALRLMGSVDRVDEGDGGLEILDYKTGNVKTTADVRDGKAFQLPAYLAAISKLAGTAPRGMGYLQVPTDGPIKHVDVTQSHGKPAYDVAELVTRKLPERLARMLAGMRHGVFLHLPWAPPGKPCSYCDYRTACAKRDDVISERQARIIEVENVYLPDSA